MSNDSKFEKFLNDFIVGEKYYFLIIPLFVGIITTLFTQFADLAWIMVVITLVIFDYKRRSYKSKNKVEEHLRAIKSLPKEQKSRIKRNAMAEDIAKKIIKRSYKPLYIIVGSSGSGKSVLIKEYIPTFYKKNVKQIYFDEYNKIERDICEGIHEEYNDINSDKALLAIDLIPKDDFIVFVFDQFESVFLIKPNDAIKQLKFLCEFFKKCRNKNVKCVIILRKEWFLNLKFFQDFVPHISEVSIVEGINISLENIPLKNIEESIIGIIKETDLINKVLGASKSVRNPDGYYVTSCKEINNINSIAQKEYYLPVELITLSETIRLNIEINPVDMRFISKDQAVKEYFNHFLMASSNYRDALRILFTLSVEPKSNRTLDIPTIMRLTDLSGEKIYDVLEFFTVNGKSTLLSEKDNIKKLLIKKENGYDWKHDYYAEKFFEVSGSLLDPIDRDNISFFWSQKEKILKLYPVEKVKEEKEKKMKYEKFGVSIFIVSVLLLLLRTFLPVQLFNDYSLLKVDPIFKFDFIDNLHFDISFLPIAISLLFWSWYVTSLFRRLLSGLEEKKWCSSWILSHFVIAWSLFGIVCSVIYPQSWIFLTGICGFVVGLKYRQIIKVTRDTSTYFDESTLRRVGRETVINSIFLIILFGPTYALLFPPFSIISKLSQNVLGIITYVISFIMIYFAANSIKNHISYSRIPMFLGIFKRYKLMMYEN